MPLTTHHDAELTAQHISSLLAGLSHLLSKSQQLAALSQFHWVVHCAERGFLSQSNIAQLIQHIQTVLPLCNHEEQIKLYSRLLTLSERFELHEAQVTIAQMLSRLHRLSVTPKAQSTKHLYLSPRPEHYDKQLASLAFLTKAHHHLTTVPLEKQAEMTRNNTHELNELETQTHYDLIVPVYIEQLREYRRQSANKVMSVLVQIQQFCQRLQAEGLYQHAYSLCHMALYELRVNQNFYETTCLQTVDERFLLKSLCKLQENCLADIPPQADITFTWSQNLSALQALRADKKRAVEKLMSSIDTLRYSSSLIENVETLQHDITLSMKTFLANLFKQAESQLGPPPCDYCLMALGSIARGDMTPYSDLESVCLVEKPLAPSSIEHLYFETLWKLIAFQIQALGESYDEHPGLHIDKECHPLLPGLITTPERLIEIHGPKTITTDESSEGLLALTLLNTTPVHTHEQADKPETLFAEYQRRLNAELTASESQSQEKAREQLGRAARDFKQQQPLHLQAACSIKSTFLAPFAYLLGVLTFYHHFETGQHPLILKRLVEIQCLEPTFANASCAALAELNLLRLNQHLQADQAHDILPSHLPQNQQERLRHLWHGMLYPAYTALYPLTQTNEPTHPVFDMLSRLTAEATPPTPEKQEEEVLTPLLHYLLYTQSPNNPYSSFIDVYHRLPVAWRPSLLKRIEEVTLWSIESRYQQELLTVLEAQTNPDGWQPRMEKEQTAWMYAMTALFEPLGPEALTQAMNQQKTIVYMPSSGIGLKVYRFKKEVFNQLFNPDGTPKQKSGAQPGRHLVLRVNDQGYSFWFKFMPEQAGTEFAISRLERYLGGQNTPMTQMAKLCHGNECSMALQISAHISGLTLEDCLNLHPDNVANIEIASFTQTLLRVLLTNPEDDKGDDYFLVPSDDGKQYRLVRIDNERAYYQPNTTEGRLVRTKVLQVKSALYCLDQMQKPLSEAILDAFLRLDTFAMLEHWLRELIVEQEHYVALFNENEVREHFRNKHPGPSILGLPMAVGLIKELLTRLDSMQQVIRLARKQHQPVIGIDLLRVVQPQLAEYYEKAFRTHPIPQTSQEASSTAQAAATLARFNQVTQGLYDITPQGYKQSSYSTVKAVSQSLRLTTELTEQDVLAIAQGKTMGPLQALETLQQLQKAEITAIEHALLSEQKDSLVRFQDLAVRHQLLIINNITGSIKKGLVLTSSQQTHCLKAYAVVPFHVLDLSCYRQTLTDDQLIPLLRGSHKHLLSLNLTSCSLLTSKIMEVIATICPHLENLQLSDIKGPRSTPWVFNNIHFPNLKELVAVHCEPLTLLHLKAPLLEKLNVSECPHLTTIEIGSPTLFEVHAEHCVALTEAGIEYLTSYPQRLKVLMLTGCHQIPHLDFRYQFCGFGSEHLSLLSTKEIERLEQEISQLLKETVQAWVNIPGAIRLDWVDALRNILHFRASFIEPLRNELIKFFSDHKKEITRFGLGAANISSAGSDAIKAFDALSGVASPEQTATLIPPLVKVAEESNRWWVNRAAIEALGTCGSVSPEQTPTLVPILLKELVDSKLKWPVRAGAAKALGTLGGISPEHTARLIPPLLKVLGDHDSGVNLRIVTARALGTLARVFPDQTVALIPSIQKALGASQGSWSAEAVTAEALGTLGSASPEQIAALISPLLEALNDDEWMVRQTVVEALGTLGSTFPEQTAVLIPPLLTALRDSHWKVAGAATKALCTLGNIVPSDQTILVIPVLLRALEDSNRLIRKNASKVFGVLANASSKHTTTLISTLLNALGDLKENGPQVNVATLEILTALISTASPEQIAETISPLLNALEDGKPEIKAAVTRVLAVLARAVSPEQIARMISSLLIALEDSDDDVRVAAVKALGKFASTSLEQTTRLMPILLKVLAFETKLLRLSPNREVAIAARQALTALGSASTEQGLVLIPKLIRLLEGRDFLIGDLKGMVCKILIKLLPTFSITTLLKQWELQLRSQETRPHLSTQRNMSDQSDSPHYPATSLKTFDLCGTSQRVFQDHDIANIDFIHAETINLSTNQITGKGAQILCQRLLFAASLKKLNLWLNPIGGDGASAIGNLLAQHQSLQQLIISETQITHHGSYLIAKGLSANRYLEFLDISYNSLGDEGALVLADALKMHPRLTRLCLNGNEIGERGGKALLELVITNTHITDIELDNNSMPDLLLQLILQTVENNKAQKTDPTHSAVSASLIDSKKRTELFGEKDMSASMQHRMRQLVITALPATGYAVGKAVSDGDCFFDAVAQALNEAQDSRTLTLESLRRLCSNYAEALEREHPATTMDPEEEAEDTNWIFKAFGHRHDLYQKYLQQVALTAGEATFLEEHYKIGDGLAIWGEQGIDAVILCRHFNIRIHVIELHDELLDQTELPPVLHQLIDSTGARPLENPEHDIYQAPNTIHLIVGRNHFCPILKTASLTEFYEQHGFLRPATTSSSSASSSAAAAAVASPTLD